MTKVVCLVRVSKLTKPYGHYFTWKSITMLEILGCMEHGL
jgi:hypothetical protein